MSHFAANDTGFSERAPMLQHEAATRAGEEQSSGNQYTLNHSDKTGLTTGATPPLDTSAGSLSSAKASGGAGDDVTVMEVLQSMLLSVYMPSILFGLTDGLSLPIMPIFAKQLSPGSEYLGLAMGAVPLGKALGDWPAGLLFAAHGYKTTMMTGMACVALSAFLLANCTSYGLMLCSLLLTGISSAFFTVSRSSHMRHCVQTRFRGRAVSLLAGINRFTRALGPSIGGMLAQHYGLSAPIYASCCCASIATILVYKFVPYAAPASTEHAKESHCALDIVVSHKHVYATAGVSAFVLAFLRRARNLLIPLKGHSSAMEPSKIGFAVTCGYVADTLLFAPVGVLMDTHGRKLAGLPAYLVLSFGLMLLGPSDTLFSLVVAVVVMGIGDGLSSGLNMTLAGDLAPPAPRTGQFVGVWNLICDLGAMSGPVIMGWLMRSGSLENACNGAALFGLFGALWFGCLVKETLKRPRTAEHSQAA